MNLIAKLRNGRLANFGNGYNGEFFGQVADELERLKRDLDFAHDTNNFDATRLRRLATLVGASVPESDETLLGCAGTVIGSICRQVEGLFKRTEELRSALVEVSGCHEKHDTPKLCQGCLMSIEKVLAGAVRQPQDGKWVLHLIGPDDVIDQPDEVTALREANKINIGLARRRAEDPSDHDPHCWAVVKDASAESV